MFTQIYAQHLAYVTLC